MRYALDHKAQTHERIIKEASARFRRDGIGATGLQPLMKALGLTHGGFYAHFKSKDDLVEQALRSAAKEAEETIGKFFAMEDPLSGLIDLYLSTEHRDSPESGCPLPNICAELGQTGKPSITTDEIILHLQSSFAKVLPGENTEERSISILSTLVGALVLSRSTQDAKLSEQILNNTRDRLKQEIKEVR
ncbi:TetR/AcrR family transcriptional regulator [Pseudomonas sp. KFB-139]|uniref:TetR/AcrR family transcriptional regulator n=1 Tax=Pseudomonas serbiensis TaxID=3064350 RepID=A0ABT9CNX0_9PSED|nr:TetR/AcrR family transcriptional regulator [Pseudomonas sp. KFB-138]MDO7926538.1 TetR/AcrR family transcriptional regulator [Pseudomonas sp. KFB-138]